jgi:hypothetical protein
MVQHWLVDRIGNKWRNGIFYFFFFKLSICLVNLLFASNSDNDEKWSTVNLVTNCLLLAICFVELMVG